MVRISKAPYKNPNIQAIQHTITTPGVLQWGAFIKAY